MIFNGRTEEQRKRLGFTSEELEKRLLDSPFGVEGKKMGQKMAVG